MGGPTEISTKFCDPVGIGTNSTDTPADTKCRKDTVQNAKIGFMEVLGPTVGDKSGWLACELVFIWIAVESFGI